MWAVFLSKTYPPIYTIIVPIISSIRPPYTSRSEYLSNYHHCIMRKRRIRPIWACIVSQTCVAADRMSKICYISGSFVAALGCDATNTTNIVSNIDIEVWDAVFGIDIYVLRVQLTRILFLWGVRCKIHVLQYITKINPPIGISRYMALSSYMIKN